MKLMPMPKTSRRPGRPTDEETALHPSVRVEPCEIPQPPLLGLRNPPCCGIPMAPRYRKRLGSPELRRWKVQCSHCGRWLAVVYAPDGRPVIGRVIV